MDVFIENKDRQLITVHRAMWMARLQTFADLKCKLDIYVNEAGKIEVCEVD